jgi:hypothetical protein
MVSTGGKKEKEISHPAASNTRSILPKRLSKTNKKMIERRKEKQNLPLLFHVV